jgi:hypothetical protein
VSNVHTSAGGWDTSVCRDAQYVVCQSLIDDGQELVSKTHSQLGVFASLDMTEIC